MQFMIPAKFDVCLMLLTAVNWVIKYSST